MQIVINMEVYPWMHVGLHLKNAWSRVVVARTSIIFLIQIQVSPIIWPVPTLLS